MLKALYNRIRIWKENVELPVLAPMEKGNAIVITAYLNQGRVVVTYDGKVKQGEFGKKILRDMMKGPDVRRRVNAMKEFVTGLGNILGNFYN